LQRYNELHNRKDAGTLTQSRKGAKTHPRALTFGLGAT